MWYFYTKIASEAIMPHGGLMLSRPCLLASYVPSGIMVDSLCDMYTCTHTYTCIHTHTHACTHTHILAHIHTCLHTHTHMLAHTHTHTCLHTHTHAHTHIHACTHTHVIPLYLIVCWYCLDNLFLLYRYIQSLILCIWNLYYVGSPLKSAQEVLHVFTVDMHG